MLVPSEAFSPPSSPIFEVRVAIPRTNLHLYQNIEKKWSLALDKILDFGLYSGSAGTRQVGMSSEASRKLW